MIVWLVFSFLITWRFFFFFFHDVIYNHGYCIHFSLRLLFFPSSIVWLLILFFHYQVFFFFFCCVIVVFIPPLTFLPFLCLLCNSSSHSTTDIQQSLRVWWDFACATIFLIYLINLYSVPYYSSNCIWTYEAEKFKEKQHSGLKKSHIFGTTAFLRGLFLATQ